MDHPEPPIEEDELPVPVPASEKKRRFRKKRIRIDKSTMYGIELHRRNLRIRLMIALGVLVFGGLVMLVVAWYPGSGGFAKRLDRMVLHSTGAQVEMRNVVLTPFTASADQFEANWPEGNFLQSLSAERLAGRVLPQRHFGRRYGGDELKATSGRLILRYPDAGSPAVATGDSPGKSRVAFKRLGVPRFDVWFGEPEAPHAARLVQTEAAFYENGPAGVPRALIYSGSLKTPYWSDFLVERAIIDFPAGRCQVVGLRIRDQVRERDTESLVGWADIAGEFSLDPTETSILQLQLDGFQIEALVGTEAGRFFQGRVNTRAGENTGVVHISKDEGLQMRAELVGSQVSEFTFRHFPFLGFISRAVDDRWFLNPVFDDEPKMVLIRDGGLRVFDDIHFTSRRRMVVRGSISIDADDGVSGELEVGLSPTVIDSAVARRLDGMFSAERDGFRWITLELGGTTQVPTDNFNAQFIEAPMPEIEIPQFQPPPVSPEPEPEQQPAPEPPRRPRPPSVLPLLDLDED